MKRVLIFHPLLFALYAILAPAANNIAYIGLGLIKTLLMVLVFVSGVIWVVNRLVRQREKAGLISSGVVVVFAAYGHVNTLLSGRLGAALGMDIALLIVGVGLIAAWSYWVLRRYTANGLLNNYLNVVGLILIVFPVYTFLTFSRQTSQVVLLGQDFGRQVHTVGGVAETRLAPHRPEAARPDVYYLVLDSYTRADVLAEVYGYDNTPFIKALQRRGFYVAEASHSNYADTVFSTAASLNMAHIQSAPEFAQTAGGITELEPLRDMVSGIILENRVNQLLQQAGYQTVVFDSGHDRLNFAVTDYAERSPKIGRFDTQAAFDMMMMDTSLGKLYFNLRGADYMPLQSQFDNHRERVRFALTHLPQYAAAEGSYFVYSHVLSPHSPYVFGPNGEPRHSADPFTLMEGFASAEWKPDLYRDQVNYLNSLVLATIDEILASSDPQPIIILQGDHGSRSYPTRDQPDDLRMQLQFPILNAYYLPGAPAGELLYPSITPVNTFRVVFNHYFGTQLPLLPDTSYLLEERQGRLTFVDVCVAYAACPQP